VSAADETADAKAGFRSNNTSFTGSLKNVNSVTPNRLKRGGSSIALNNNLALRRSRSFQGIEDDGTIEATGKKYGSFFIALFPFLSVLILSKLQLSSVLSSNTNKKKL